MKSLVDLKNFLEGHFPSALRIECSGDLYHVSICIVDPQFQGLRTLQRHQKVYPILKPLVSANALHAITLNTKTPEEDQCV